jgi:hypothetical protein
MKKILIIWIFIFQYTVSTDAQYSRDKEYLSHYGIDFSEINSGSGHGSGLSLNFNIQKGRKALSFGAVYQPRENKISGVDFKYRIFLGQFDESVYRTRILRPYLQYNLSYKKATVDAPVIIPAANSYIELPDSEQGTIGTMEHYAAFGLQLSLYKNIYFDSSLGMGIYIGSLDKINHPNTIGIHGENHGFTGSVKIGIGVRIN